MDETRLSVKNKDTEEWIDIVYTRPIGYLWARLFRRLGVKPNTVTLLSMALGAAAGVCFFFSPRTCPSHWLAVNAAGVVLLAWANFYDSADGQLARMTGQTSELGRILDGAAGDVWYFVIYWAIALRLWNETIPFTSIHWGWIAVAVGALDGFVAHTRQCRLADYYRNLHIYFYNGCKGNIDSYPQQKALYQVMPWRGNLVRKAFLALYVNYVHEQEKATPNFQRLLASLRLRYGHDIPPGTRQAFLAQSRRILWCTNALTFNQRAIGLYLACLLNIPWLLFLIEMGYLGAIHLYMKLRHERACRLLTPQP